MQGKRVRTTIFDTDTDLFENILTVLNSYYVSNMSVCPAHPSYHFGDTEYQWFINNQSHIEEVREEEDDIKRSFYNFIQLSNIKKSDSYAEIGK